ncbi:MAG: chain-length determining protein [Prevotella sp.]|nr:chain-length determining protein [Prevotella sp.]
MEENKAKKSHEIDVIGIARQILKEKKLLLKFLIIFLVIGVIVALNKPKTYTSEVILAPEMSAGGLGMSSSLADMASTFGFDIGGKSSMDAIYPEIYPEVFASTTFIMELTDVPVRTTSDNTLKTFEQHLKLDTKVPFWNYPLIWIGQLLAPRPSEGPANGNASTYLSKAEDELCNAIRGSISCEVSSKTSLISIKVKDQDPLAATILADTIHRRLQKYITAYRTQKARNDVEYYQKLLDENEEQYKEALLKYASYTDSHSNTQMATYQTKGEKLENEVQISLAAYNQVAAQLQTANAKVQECTPAFTVIQPASIPYKASSTPRSLIVVFFLLLGIVADGIWIFYIRDFLKQRKK